MDNQRGMTTAIQSPSMTVSRKHPTILGSHHRLLDLLAIITATTCMLVVLLTLIMCSLDPAGRWAVDANSKGGTAAGTDHHHHCSTVIHHPPVRVGSQQAMDYI